MAFLQKFLKLFASRIEDVFQEQGSLEVVRVEPTPVVLTEIRPKDLRDFAPVHDIDARERLLDRLRWRAALYGEYQIADVTDPHTGEVTISYLHRDDLPVQR